MYEIGESIDVLDKGYVRLKDKMGDDTTIVNSARVSFDKQVNQLSEKDVRLIKFLAEDNHTSPFRHASLQFEVYAPLMVARQWWKHVVGSDHTMEAWNESSRRYVTEEPTFYIPKDTEWRSTPENRKQGSGDPIDVRFGEYFTKLLMRLVDDCEDLYNDALAHDVCAEQARLFLPAYGMYVRWYWTASLQSVLHFLNLRLDSHAQKEIQVYADAVYRFTKEHFPVSTAQWIKE